MSILKQYKGNVNFILSLNPFCVSFITYNSGVAISQEYGATVEQLMNSVDKAMYCAKTEGHDWAILSGE